MRDALILISLNIIVMLIVRIIIISKKLFFHSILSSPKLGSFFSLWLHLLSNSKRKVLLNEM